MLSAEMMATLVFNHSFFFTLSIGSSQHQSNNIFKQINTFPSIPGKIYIGLLFNNLPWRWNKHSLLNQPFHQEHMYSIHVLQIMIMICVGHVDQVHKTEIQRLQDQTVNPRCSNQHLIQFDLYQHSAVEYICLAPVTEFQQLFFKLHLMTYMPFFNTQCLSCFKPRNFTKEWKTPLTKSWKVTPIPN